MAYYPFDACSEIDYGLLDANAMFERDVLAAMEEELALESQWRHMESDVCMCDLEASARELEPFFDLWGSIWGGLV